MSICINLRSMTHLFPALYYRKLRAACVSDTIISVRRFARKMMRLCVEWISWWNANDLVKKKWFLVVLAIHHSVLICRVIEALHVTRKGIGFPYFDAGRVSEKFLIRNRTERRAMIFLSKPEKGCDKLPSLGNVFCHLWWRFHVCSQEWTDQLSCTVPIVECVVFSVLSRIGDLSWKFVSVAFWFENRLHLGPTNNRSVVCPRAWSVRSFPKNNVPRNRWLPATRGCRKIAYRW